MKIATSLLALTCTLFCATAYSAPSSAIQYLMSDELTVFDFGLFRMQQWIGDYVDSPPPTVGYDWDDDLVVVSSILSRSPDTELEAAREECTTRINQVQIALVNESEPGRRALFASFFSHEGWDRTDRPDGVGKAVADRVEIRCTVIVFGTREHNARSRLGSKEIFYSVTEY